MSPRSISAASSTQGSTSGELDRWLEGLGEGLEALPPFAPRQSAEVDAGEDGAVEDALAQLVAMPLRALEGGHRPGEALGHELAVEDRAVVEDGQSSAESAEGA